MPQCAKESIFNKASKYIILLRMSLKYKDLGCLIISFDWVIQLEIALLNLGASVNLLPYTIYKLLCLGELKLTLVTLQLADKLVSKESY